MKNFIFFNFLFCFLSFGLFADDDRVIELHEENKKNITTEVDDTENQDEIIEEEVDDTENQDEIIEEEVDDTENQDEIIEEEVDDTASDLIFNSSDENSDGKKEIVNEIEEETSVITMPDFWENSNKENLEFLFNNLRSPNSKVITTFFADILSQNSKSPKAYTKQEFDNLRIKTLLNMGYREDALRVLKDISTYEYYQDYYDRLILNYYLTIYKLSEVCDYKESLKEIKDDKDYNILKISIFCSFLENNLDEADFLNSLLLDIKNTDAFFQKIFYNLKNNIIEPIDLEKTNFDPSSFALYSAMLRVGNLPFNEKFLEFDPINLSLPIILSPSSDISLRLKSAHKAYDLGIFSADSLSALYQSVDFTSEELNNANKTIENYVFKPEIGMALLFQKARIQLLPITRLESLKEFWDHASKHNFEKLAYKVSENLIDSIDPSIEILEYSLLLAKGHILNQNFKQAEKWISFADNYLLQSDELDAETLNNIKFHHNLKISQNKISFINILERNLISRIEKEHYVKGLDSNLKTIFALIINQQNLVDKIKDNKQIFDERIMPSSYIINIIKYSADSKNIGELILATLVSLDGKSWNEVHPQHLELLLKSFKVVKLDDLFKKIIIEIFEESKMI